MSPSESPITDGESDPSIEIYGSDVDVSASEEPDEEEVEEEIEEKEVQGEGKVTDPPVDASNNQKDLSEYLESEGQKGNLRPVSLVAENPEVLQSVSVPSHEITSSPNLRKNLVTAEDDKSQGSDHIESAYLCGVKDINSRITKSSTDTGKDVDIDFLQKDCFVEDANGGQNSVSGIGQLEMHSGDHTKQMTSRFTAPDMRTRSLSPSAEMKDGSKRPAIICAFFAKGWCIRGSSCSFLHIKDNVDNTGEQAERDIVTANWSREVQLEEGNRDNAERLKNEKEASPSHHLPQKKHKFLLLHKDALSSEDNALPMGGGSFTSRNVLFPHNRITSNASRNYLSTHVSSYPTCVERMGTLLSQHMYNRYTSPFMSHSCNSSLDTHLPSTSTSLSHQISAQSVASTLNAQTLLNSDKEYHAPRSTFSGSERGDLPLTSSYGVLPHPSGCKSKISYDWEPSIPFQPSFFITSMIISSPGDRYDPLCDSVEILNIGDGSLKASFFTQGTSIQTSSQVRTHVESAVGGNQGAALSDDKSSVSSHNRFYENEPKKSCLPCVKYLQATETETMAGTHAHCQNGKVGMRENTFGFEDITKNEKGRAMCDARHQSEGSGHTKRRVDMNRANNEMDVEFQMDGNAQKQSKAMINFRVALVYLVKELLKPAWHEGHLSKDAHNMIVKKSVDKVLRTLQPHQIPTTIDTVKHFVSSSRVKIAKLIDGYVNKYGKS